jgi:hypothetical protein
MRQARWLGGQPGQQFHQLPADTASEDSYADRAVLSCVLTLAGLPAAVGLASGCGSAQPLVEDFSTSTNVGVLPVVVESSSDLTGPTPGASHVSTTTFTLTRLNCQVQRRGLDPEYQRGVMRLAGVQHGLRRPDDAARGNGDLAGAVSGLDVGHVMLPSL